VLRLWYARGSVALAAQIALEEAGATYEARELVLRDGAQRRPEYLAVNPLGRVPALETPQGVLTEVLAILDYIAATHPAAGLMPADPFRRARALSLHSYLASVVHVAHAHGRKGARWADDPAAVAAMTAKMPANMAEAMALIEDHLFVGPWALGAAFSTADAHLFAIWRWLPGDGVDPAQFPRLAAHGAAMRARPAVARALAHHV
jgi:glutathione S-transferase